jgi:ribosomal protein S18 acetylase RimI-like enzyme
MGTTFQDAKHSDMDRLLEMRQDFCRHEEIAFDASRAYAALAQLLGVPSLGRVWLVENDGELVGYIVLTFGYSLEFDGRDAYVDEIYLKESCRGRGLGRNTLRFAEAKCAQLGVRALHLEVDRNNARALAVYLKAGFEDRNNFLLTKRLAAPMG